MTSGASITYLFHDCFIVETEKTILIFDYWKDPSATPEEKEFPPILKELDRRKNIYVFISHHHKDHFTRKVFLWQRLVPEIRYILSRDVYDSVRYLFQKKGNYSGYKPTEGSVKVLRPGESYHDENLRALAFGSTDIGNSYGVELEGTRLFHAGDLNAWLWLDESTPEEIEEARRDFTEIVEDVKREFEEFDVVMFPVDSRLGREYWWGAEYFITNIDTKLFFPMHYELGETREVVAKRHADARAFGERAIEFVGEYIYLPSRGKVYLKEG